MLGDSSRDTACRMSNPAGLGRRLVWLSGLIFCLLSGCQTSDYEPVLLKEKIRGLEEQLAKLESAPPPAARADDAGLADRLQKTEAALKRLEDEVRSLRERAAAEESARSAQLLQKISDLGGTGTVDPASGRLTRVDLSNARYTNEDLAGILAAGSVVELLINGPASNEETFAILGRARQLENLDASRSPATAAAMGHLASLPRLKILQLFKADISDESLQVVGGFPALEQLRMAQTRVGDDGIRHLGRLRTLRAIELTDCNRVSDLGVATLAGLPKLVFLKVWGPQITDASLVDIARLSELRTLALNDTRITDRGIASLVALKKLEELQVLRTGVGDAALQSLAGMPSLRSLSLRGTAISDRGLLALANLPRLEILDVSETQSPGLTDDSAAAFAQMKALKEINLWRTRVSDQTVQALAGLPALRKVNLDKTAITDRSVELLAKVPELSWLHIGSNQITDAAIPELLKMQKLKYLDVSFTKISEEKFYDLYDLLEARGCELVGP